MEIREINVIEEFSKKPYGRSPEKVMKGEENDTGLVFRNTLLTPKLKNCISKGEKLKVILTGYNRYGRSFLDEAFGGLIRDDNFTYAELEKHLEIEHKDVQSIVKLSWDRIKDAALKKGEVNEA
ncbi:STAS-like domain-containing protein [Avibacterium gallinarum]|uniref:Uncharacterized protein DUF4325 n=1 Tax=Avibacterium gallinarum TaxID=755 RepID=A0A379AV84_AVIGA|nr:STAS-like domain-containing protein [Avibacterium gallinarum]TDP28567.1 uncharacterized protein DUF4325 [Avibacterium gallinarum]SUB26257.1 Uncharacterised protein [Avibacterium gallinarum]